MALLLAKLLGYLFDRFNQPVVIGEIIAGILMGSYFLGRLNGTYPVFGLEIPVFVPDLGGETFEMFGFLGIIMLLFISGLETDLKRIKKTERTGIGTAIGGVLLPFVFGFLIGNWFGFSFKASLAAGAIFVATSVGVTARTLMDMKAFDSDVGATILSAAVIDDVIGIFVLALVLGTGEPHFLALKVAIFFLITLYLGLKIIAKVLGKFEIIQAPKTLVTIGLVICFFFSLLAMQMGMAAITGAFVAGLIIGTTLQSREISEDVQTVGYTLFIPLFFVWVGASLDLGSLTQVGMLAVFFIPLGIIGKIVGCGLGSKFAGLTSKRALAVGVGMIPKMEVALIVVTTAIAQGIFPGELAHQMLAVTVLHAITTTLLSPILVRAIMRRIDS